MAVAYADTPVELHPVAASLGAGSPREAGNRGQASNAWMTVGARSRCLNREEHVETSTNGVGDGQGSASRTKGSWSWVARVAELTAWGTAALIVLILNVADIPSDVYWRGLVVVAALVAWLLIFFRRAAAPSAGAAGGRWRPPGPSGGRVRLRHVRVAAQATSPRPRSCSYR